MDLAFCRLTVTVWNQIGIEKDQKMIQQLHLYKEKCFFLHVQMVNNKQNKKASVNDVKGEGYLSQSQAISAVEVSTWKKPNSTPV